MYAPVFSSYGKMPFLPPASIAMFAIVIRSSMFIAFTPGPSHCIARYVAPSKPISPMTCRITSFAITPAGSAPSQ